MIPDQWDKTPREFIETRENVVVNNYAQYCSVVKTGIGKAKMLIGGEVDACTLRWFPGPIAIITTCLQLPSMGLQTGKQG